ncbi:bifunctional 3-oxoadipate enol-lactonase/4-carboxymuconolactone decarboxylase PcaDC [Nocardioides zeae]|uniref:3-oxoadipate enol-lactonase/4-carboxymuconolactone decarboxylase n=1 Tax=Nocardioides zeae TaxID=1457234 RepID=A0AAJ1U8Q0_9ACTN|nr:alpha/beta fold hydrolase [Nocardioides zeae]MDQ1106436.1 3-oxoadipate enol-lactonase/4-carboxymuconolactone decarboxylase [Nocardioides zeae]
MSVPVIDGVELSEAGNGPLLLLGPSLGTSATALWERSAALLAADHHVVGWDLPGHGTSPAPADGFTMAELAGGVLAFAERLLRERGEASGTFVYAGVSVGGAVGLQLLLDAPERVAAAALICTGAKIGTPDGWHERAAMVRAFGTATMVEGSAKRWFAPGFLEREPEVGRALLASLEETDTAGYAAVCKALAAFDVRDRLGAIRVPVLAVAGAADEPTPPSDLETIAALVADGRTVVLDGVAHLAPAEAPAEVADLLRAHLKQGAVITESQRAAAGAVVRRQVLGDDHLDGAGAAPTAFTRDFDDLVTQYAWGSVWARPGLDRRSRSLVALSTLVAQRDHDELATHVRAALRNGLTVEELAEVFLQASVHCGTAAAAAAFRVAQETLRADGVEL